MEIQRRYNVITREKPSTHSSEVGKCKELILKKIYRNNKYVHPQHSSSRCGLNTFRMPKPHLFCDLQLNQKVWLCAARGRGLWEEKNKGDDVLVSHRLFAAHVGSVDNGHHGCIWPVLQTINSVLHWQLCVCVPCVSSQSGALLWPSLEPVVGNWWKWVMSWAAPELTVAMLPCSTACHAVH